IALGANMPSLGTPTGRKLRPGATNATPCHRQRGRLSAYLQSLTDSKVKRPSRKVELLLHGLCNELRLALLSEAAVMEYLTLRFSSPLGSNSSSGHHQDEGAAQVPLRKLAHTIYQRTDGNPLFIVNVVDYMVEHEGDAVLAQ